MISEEDVTIVIPTLATPFTKRALDFCLESLDATTKAKRIISYNGPGHDVPQGQCRATNAAAEQVTTPWMLVMNDDMVAWQNDWLSKLLYTVDNLGLLVASPNLVEPRRGAQPFLEHFCGGIGTEGTNPDYNATCVQDFVNTYKENETRLYSAVEDGFNMPFLIRKDVWDTVGGYDEAYDPWGSCCDTDLQTRLMIAGITPKRVRSVLVYHFSQTSGTFSADTESFRHANWRYYESKFGFPSFKNPEVWYRPEIPESNKFHPPYEAAFRR